VDVSRSVWVSVEQLEKLAGRTVVRDRVRGRLETVKGVLSVLVGDELAPKITVDLLVVLLFVQTWAAFVSGCSLS
jgi:hypothetical protein